MDCVQRGVPKNPASLPQWLEKGATPLFQSSQLCGKIRPGLPLSSPLFNRPRKALQTFNDDFHGRLQPLLLAAAQPVQGRHMPARLIAAPTSRHLVFNPGRPPLQPWHQMIQRGLAITRGETPQTPHTVRAISLQSAFQPLRPRKLALFERFHARHDTRLECWFNSESTCRKGWNPADSRPSGKSAAFFHFSKTFHPPPP